MDKALQQAAQAVLDRWNSPKWDWHKQGPTADLMHALQAAIAQPAQPSSITENIRNAAINWPQFLGDVESHIVYSLVGIMEFPNFGEIDGRMFLLFVAEALES